MQKDEGFSGWWQPERKPTSQEPVSHSAFDKARTQIESSLMKSETLLRTLVAVREERNLLGSDQGVLALTNKRIIYQGKGLLGTGSRVEWRLDKVNGISQNQSLLREYIELHAGSLAIKFFVFLGDSLEFIERANELLSTKPPEPTKTSQHKLSLAEQLEKLGDLLDRGVLSQEEFMQAKMKILNSESSSHSPDGMSSKLDFSDSYQEDAPEIVGESFYSASFEKIRVMLGLQIDEEAAVQIELVADPNNPHSTSGKAVAVYVLGEQVGHIAEFDAPDVFDSLDNWDSQGRKSFPGRIYFGRNNNSVQLLDDLR